MPVNKTAVSSQCDLRKDAVHDEAPVMVARIFQDLPSALRRNASIAASAVSRRAVKVVVGKLNLDQRDVVRIERY